MLLSGHLLTYSSGLCAFLHNGGCNSRSPSSYCVLVGGLTDGPGGLPYAEKLAKALERECSVSLVMPVLRSSYAGYGISSLEKDAEDLSELILSLPSSGGGNIFLMGHSTGAQTAVTFMKIGVESARDRVCGVILQAPVSDREMMEFQMPRREEFIELAKSMDGDDLMPRDADPCELGNPITAKRFLSLADKHGSDDLFSSDFADNELREKLGHMDRVRCLVLFSIRDEYVPPSVDREALCERLAAAMCGRGVLLDATHNLKGLEDEVASTVSSFVSECLSK